MDIVAADELGLDQERLDRLAELNPLQYAVTQQAYTEPAFTGAYWDNHETGTYRCVVCDSPLFESGTKFESGSGWPSFSAMRSTMSSLNVSPSSSAWTCASAAV